MPGPTTMPVMFEQSWLTSVVGTVMAAAFLAVVGFIMENRSTVQELKRESQVMDEQLSGRMDRMADHLLVMDHRIDRITDWISESAQTELDSAFDTAPGRPGRR